MKGLKRKGVDVQEICSSLVNELINECLNIHVEIRETVEQLLFNVCNLNL